VERMPTALVPEQRRGSMPAVSDDAPGWPAVSVIVYSQDEADALASLLPVILNQDYPAAFEVIVVNEGDSSDVRNTVEPMQLAYRNLYLTHTPDGARNLSRKKLAITLGVKAARYEVVVLTTVAAIIGSDKWLRAMTSQMVTDPARQIVLGYAAPVPRRRPRPRTPATHLQLCGRQRRMAGSGSQPTPVSRHRTESGIP